jgi:hypothetical protein
MKPLCKVLRDKSGSYYIIPEDLEKPEVVAWWQRPAAAARPTRKHALAASAEKLVLRQETPGRPTADVIELSFGQVYALIDALNRTVEDY